MRLCKYLYQSNAEVEATESSKATKKMIEAVIMIELLLLLLLVDASRNCQCTNRGNQVESTEVCM